ncbi:beta strand repeat-containing protein, partial [Marinigracilibium pacificum]
MRSLNKTYAHFDPTLISDRNRIVFLFLFFLISSLGIKAQVIVTPATGGENVCADGNFVSLGDISILENSAADFSAVGNYSVDIILPAGFEFNTTNLSLYSTPQGSEIFVINDVYPFTNVYSVNISVVSAGFSIDELVISGLQVKLTGGESSGNILFGGGSSNVFGLFGANAGNLSFSIVDGTLSGGAMICSGASTNLTFNFTGGTAPYNVVYSDGTTNYTVNNINDGATVSVSPSTTTTYSLVSVTDANGCADATPTGTAVVTVSPTVSGNLAANASQLCAGESVDLTFTLSGSSTNYDVSYTDGSTTFNLVGISSGHVETITPSATATYSITSVTANASGCNTTTNVSGTPTITVNPVPDGSMSGGGTICSGGNASLTFNLSSGSSPYDVVYTDGITNYTANNITNGTSVSVSPTLTTTYSIVSVTDNNGCTDPTPTGSATVTVSPTVSGSLGANASIICNGESVDLLFSLSGSATTYNVTYTDGTTPVILNGINNGHVETIIPSATATYSILNVTSVSSGCTTSSNVSGTPTVTVNPVPDGSMSGGGTICSGGSASLTFNLSSGSSPYDVVYTDGITNYTANNITNGTSVSVSPTLTTTYSIVSVTDNNGCTDPTPTGSATVTVSPTVSGSLGVNASIICNGESVDLSFSLSGSATTYNVTYTDGTTPIILNGINNGHVETIIPSATVTYSILNVTSVSSGCTTSSNVSGTPTVTVNPVPDGTLSGGATICSGASTNLTFNFTGGTAPYNVVYSDGTTNYTVNNINDGATVSVSPSTTTTYSLVSVTDANGCADATPTGTAVVTVSPTVSGNLAANASQLCAGESVDLTFMLSGSTTNYDVSYSDGSTTFNLTGISSGHVETITPSATATYSILNVTSVSSGCTTSSNVSGTPTVTVNPVPDGTLSGGATICSGASTNLTFNFTGGTAPYNVVYSDGTTNYTVNNINDGATVSVSPSATTTYSLVSVSDANGCADATPTGTAVVTVSPTVSGNLAANASQFCAGESVDLTFTLSGSSTNYDVSYTDGSTTFNLVGISSGHVETITPSATATYSITSVTANASGCNTTTNVSGTPTVTVNPVPDGTLSGGATICSGASTNLTFNFTGGTAPYNVVYSDGTKNYTVNNINDGATVSVSPSTTTTYSLVSVTDANGCADATPTGTAVVTVSPTVSGNLAANASQLCAGESVDLTFTLSGSTTNY